FAYQFLILCFKINIFAPTYSKTKIMLAKIPCLLYCVVAMVSFMSCKTTYQDDIYVIAANKMDSLFMANVQLVWQKPDSARMLLRKKQGVVSDSILKYYYDVRIGMCFFVGNRLDSALWYYKKVKRFCDSNSKDVSGKYILAGTNENLRGLIFGNINKRDSALICFTNARNNCYHTTYRHGLLDVCINAADMCRFLGKLPESAEWLRQSLSLADSLNKSSTKHSIFVGLGQVYSDLRNFEKSQEYFSMAETLYPPQTDYEQYFYYNSRGTSYYSAENYFEALKYFRKGYSVAKTIKYAACKSTIELNMGEVFLKLGQLDSSKYYLDLGSQYFKGDLKDNAVTFYMNGLYASLALEMGNMKEAEHYLMQPYNKNAMPPSYLYNYNNNLLTYYKKKGDYKNALFYKEEVTRYDDSLRNITNQNNVAEIGLRYSRDTTLLRRNAMITTAKARIAKLQWISILGITILGLLLVGITLWFRYNKIKAEKRRREQLTTIAKLRMENVRNRFSPHFIFNVLNVAISSLRQYEKEILPMQQLVQLLRYNLINADKIALSIKEEVEMATGYIYLRRSMNSTLPQIIWHIAKEVDHQWQLPTMCIQIPLENAIKHAFPPDKELASPPQITISIDALESDYFKIIIEDNGIGYIPENKLSAVGEGSAQPLKHSTSAESTGTGIKILLRTIAILNMKNLSKIEMKIIGRSFLPKNNTGTRVEITVPITYNYNI
ncbi:MAG: histidine kinase, partial [Bacteroidales bacterium]